MFEQIRRNRRRSLVVMVVMGTLLVATGASVGFAWGPTPQWAAIGAAVALALWLIQWGVLAAMGDGILLQLAGARQIEKTDHPQLFNVVEEMAIASGLGAPPRVFIVDDPAPNAFAVGRDPKKAAVAVTIGLLELLDRDELQGVVAHEIGHIRNRDVALMTTAAIMAGSVVILSELGWDAVRWGGGRSWESRDSASGTAQVILLLLALLFLLLAPLLAQLVHLALSRRREYLADASGALYTRWPEGLARALEKLSAAAIPQSDQSRVTAPMYIVRPRKKGKMRAISTAFSTHPSVEERVQILRGMAGGVDLTAYDEAYRRVRGRAGIASARTLGATDHVRARAASPPDPSEPAGRLRDASNAYLAGAGYRSVECTACGAGLKIPPALEARVAMCPRCRASLPRTSGAP